MFLQILFQFLATVYECSDRSCTLRPVSHSSSRVQVLWAGTRYVSRSERQAFQNAHVLYSFKAAANLVEHGESVLLLNSGYFGDSFAEW